MVGDGDRRARRGARGVAAPAPARVAGDPAGQDDGVRTPTSAGPGSAPPARGLRELTWRDWRDVLGRAALDMGDDAAPLLSAGVAFYMFLSVFPALLAALTVYGLVSDPGQLEVQVTSTLTAVPGEARGLLTEQAHALAARADRGASPQLALAVLGALWTASLGATGLLKAVKIAYDEPQERNFLQLRWAGILLTLGSLAFLVLAIALLAALPLVLDVLGLQGATRVAVQTLRWGGLAVLAVVALVLVYHLGADRTGAHPKWTGPGTVVAATLWVGTNAAFSWYAGSAAQYGSTYGGIAGAVVLLLWLFLTSLAVMFGAEVNAEAQRQADGQVRPRVGEAPWSRVARWSRARRRGVR